MTSVCLCVHVPGRSSAEVESNASLSDSEEEESEEVWNNNNTLYY